MKQSFEGPEVEKREVPAPPAYLLYVEDAGFTRHDESGPIGRALRSL